MVHREVQKVRQVSKKATREIFDRQNQLDCNPAGRPSYARYFRPPQRQADDREATTHSGSRVVFSGQLRLDVGNLGRRPGRDSDHLQDAGEPPTTVHQHPRDWQRRAEARLELPAQLCGWQNEPTRQQRWSQEQSQAIAQIGEDSPHSERNLVRQQRDFDPMRERCVGTEQTAAVAAILECAPPCPRPVKPRKKRGRWNHRRAMEDPTRRLDEAERPPHSAMISSERAIQISWLH